MTADPRSREKRLFFEELLQSGIATLHLDPRAAGVQVPQRFAGQEWLVLNFSYNYRIADFRFDDAEVVASLSFAGRPSRCVVPWPAVFAITNEARTKGLVWDEDLPAEVRRQQQPVAKPALADSEPEGPAPTPRAKARPRPAARPAPQPAPALAPTSTAAAPAPARPRPGLQVVPGGQDEGGPPRRRSSGSHLRRIK